MGIPETYDYESITVAGTAIGFTSSITNKNPERVVCSIETAQIRFRVDGTDPTSGEGILREVGQQIIVNSLSDITNFRAIRTGSVSSVLKCSFEK